MDRARHHGALRDRVDLLEHQHAERFGIEVEALHVLGDEERQHRAQEQRADDDPSTAALDAVDGGTDERSGDGEGRDGEHEIQRHPPSGGVEVEREEDRTGQADGEQGITGDRRRVRSGEQ